jgi:hypothetical protein
MPGHLRRRRDTAYRKQRLSITPICPTGGDRTGHPLFRSSSTMQGMAFVVASRIRPIALATYTIVFIGRSTKGASP